MIPKDEDQPAHDLNHAEDPHNETDHSKKGVTYMTTVQKWGNSLAVRIPSQIAKNLGVTNGSRIEFEELNDNMVIRPIRTKPTLDELLAKTEGKLNPHLDYDFGAPEGKELI